MLTTEELDRLKTRHLLDLHCSTCLSFPGKIYAYFSIGRKTGSVYVECGKHIIEDIQMYSDLEIIELSEKEIFYLKYHYANS